MADYVKQMKSLQLDNISEIIADLKEKRENIIAQVSDLRKKREALAEEAEQANVSLCQVNDVNAKLRETYLLTKKKVDDAIASLEEQEKFNALCATKIQEYNQKCDKERNDLALWVSEWGCKVSELSKEYVYYAKLYRPDNLENEIIAKKQEEGIVSQKVEGTKKSIAELTAESKNLEASLAEKDTCTGFLRSSEATDIIDLMKKSIATSEDEHKKLVNEGEMLLEKKKALEEWIANQK
ncbi:uncharacterized protein LOC143460294 [Clavelina lepadiformis]|uniref:uncharacterized protein LOC143460294 n=1 Tax=Clavelina lepadiformis TaxID=159417 RepID=UPI0040427BE8